MSAREISEIKNKQILIDSNILFYCGDSQFGQNARRILQVLVGNQNLLAISALSVYEVLRREWEPDDEVYYKRLLSDKRINTVPINPSILQNAIVLSRELHDKKDDIKDKKGVTCDLFIAATVMANTNALLLTSDRSSFKLPYWNLIAEDSIKRKKIEGWELVNIFVLEFNYCAISEKFMSDELRVRCYPSQTTEK